MLKSIKSRFVKGGAVVATGAALINTASAEVPAAVTTAIADVTSVGASVFTAMLAIGIPILAWRLVKRVKGA